MPKRAIDILLSLAGLIVTIPFLPIIAALIKLDSKGPVFYRATRVGKDLKLFRMYKFRTMVEVPIQVGESVSPQYDPRVTQVGRFLRRTKLNEFPQLLNVLKGEMTFVGPRPESPDLAALYPEESKGIFAVKPGLVGPNQILGRNEEEMYPPGVDAKKYYIEHILPPKVEVDLEYIRNPSLFKDFLYIFLGVKETLLGALSREHVRHNRRQLCLLLADVTLALAAYTIAYGFASGAPAGGPALVHLLLSLGVVILVRALCSFCLGLFNSLIQYLSYRDLFRLVKGAAMGSAILLACNFVFGLPAYSLTMAAMDTAILIPLLGGLRIFLVEVRRLRARRRNGAKKHRVFIFGAGDTGDAALRTLTAGNGGSFKIVGFIDDAPEKFGKTLRGVRVLGNRYHIPDLAKLHNVNEIILAASSIPPDELAKITAICQKASLKYRVFSSSRDLDTLHRLSYPLRALELSDILPLKKIVMDRAAVKSLVAGKTVLVNGSGGAMGLELCRQIIQLGCRRLIVVDRYESYLTELVADLFNLVSDDLVVPILTAADDAHALDDVFAKHRPEIVFHACMKKYVPFFEVDEDDVARANYERTFNLASLAVKHKSTHFVAISSLAAADTSCFTAQSLRLAELGLQQLFSGTRTLPVIIRVCDIIENRGGIISVIERQIRRHEAVTLPAQDAETHVLSKYSAVEYILQCLAESEAMNRTRGVFVCRSGPPIPLVHVAAKLANLYGLELDFDIPVRYSKPTTHHPTPNTNTNTNTNNQHQHQPPTPIPTRHPKISFLKENGTPDAATIRAFLKPYLPEGNGNGCGKKWPSPPQRIKDISMARWAKTIAQ